MAYPSHLTPGGWSGAQAAAAAAEALRGAQAAGEAAVRAEAERQAAAREAAMAALKAKQVAPHAQAEAARLWEQRSRGGQGEAGGAARTG